VKTKNKIRIAQILANAVIRSRRLFGLGPVVRTVRGGSEWELDLREGIDLSLYLNQYERATTSFLERAVKLGDVVIDIGANVGAQTLPLARKVGSSGRVVAVEATEFAFAKLKRNLELNPSLDDAVLPIQAILSDSWQASQFEIYSSWPVAGTTVQERHAIHCGVAKTTRGARNCSLDELVEQLQLQRIDLIKLDVDGNELSVLRSGRRALARFCPRMVVEFAPYLHRSHAGGFQSLLDEIGGAGYELFRLEGGPAVEMNQEAFRALVEEGASIDLEARPIKNFGSNHPA
jgi:FkbM family methyltransferase